MNFMSLFKTELHDAEMDIENTPVIAIDRRGNFSVFGFLHSYNDEYVKCSLKKHEEFLKRFRTKLKLNSQTL